jgi:pyruvate/2-oxoglutarate dehydrogenase complex dihydrolipoamide acyltransferase (E2) component
MPQYVILAKGHYVNTDDDRQRRAEPGEVITLTEAEALPLLGWRLVPYEPDAPLENTADLRQVEATDIAVKLAAEHDINLRDVVGTGAGGKVVKADVQAVINGDA